MLVNKSSDNGVKPTEDNLEGLDLTSQAANGGIKGNVNRC